MMWAQQIKKSNLLFWVGCAVKMWVCGADVQAAPVSSSVQRPSPQLAGNNLPVVIDADREIRCDDLKRCCVARHHVQARHGEVVLYTDKLSSFFSQPLSDPKRELLYLKAEGGVRFQSPQGKGKGESARYDIASQTLKLKGNQAELTTQAHLLKGKEIIYHHAKGQAVATGGCTFIHGQRVIQAQTLTAFFRSKPGQKGRVGPTFAAKQAWELDYVIAEGKVKVAMDNTLVTGNKGRYDAATQKAVLKGDIALLHGDHLVKGAQACLDFVAKTAVMEADSSKNDIPSGGQGAGRVRAVLVPSSHPNFKKSERLAQPKG